MKPDLSIIIPHYNHRNVLPNLLDSVMRQTGISLEVVVIDDKSDESPAEVVKEYRSKGLEICLIAHPVRQYTKTACLTGARAARGRVITFFDADDTVWGTDTLGELVRQSLDERLDILHFNLMKLDGNLKLDGLYDFAQPYRYQALKGESIFEAYVENNLKAHGVVGKIYNPELWRKIDSAAASIDVRHACDDFFLYTLLAFKASSYCGVEKAAYARHSDGLKERQERQAIGRVLTHHKMLLELLPYLRDNGCPEALLAKMSSSLQDQMEYQGELFASFVRREYGWQIPQAFVDEILEEYGDLSSCFKAMIWGSPINILSRARIAKKKIEKKYKALPWVWLAGAWVKFWRRFRGI